MLRVFVFACVVTAPAFAADEKPTAEKLVGTWRYTDAIKGNVITHTYSKDGTSKSVYELKGAKPFELTGKWKLAGDTLATDLDNNESEKLKIVKLTEDLLVLEVENKQYEMKRVKEDKK